MGCTGSSDVVIEVAYCGGCGWSSTANQVAAAIKDKLPKAVIDCRPEEGYTGLLEVYLISKANTKVKVYSGDKKTTNEKLSEVVERTVKEYNK